MRITNNFLQRETLAEIQRNLREVNTAYAQAASGLRVTKASDDPTAAGSILQADGKLRALAQYRRNVGAARSRLEIEESVLDQLTDLISRAREIAVGQTNATANTETRAIAREEVDRLLETVVQLGNTRFEGTYIFGGDYLDTPPFAADGSTDPARPPSGSRRVEISAGQIARTNHDGQEIFVDTGVIQALRDLSAALAADDPAAIGSAGSDLTESLDRVQSLLGDVGARMIQLDVAESNIEALETNLRTFRSDLSEVEFEEAVTKLVNRQTALQAAFAATSRILQTTLTDYLR